MDPICSICIANYNGARIVEDCLDAALGQDCGFPYEVIVHDDASTDDSVDIIHARYPSVTLITSDENVGFCVSNNRLAAVARGRFILLVNNDAILLPDALRTLHGEAQRLPQTILGLPQYDAKTGRLVDMGSLSDPFLNPIPNLDPERRDVAMIIGACLWIPHELWVDLGGFPTWFGSLAEDAYLCFVARLRGHPVRVLNRSGFRHWVGASLGGGRVQDGGLVTNRKRRAQTERNKTFAMVMCYPAPLLMPLLPLHLGLLLAEGVALALAKRDASLLMDIYAPLLPALWRERGRLWAERRRIQAQRMMTIREFLEPFRWLPWKLRLLFRHGLPHVH